MANTVTNWLHIRRDGWDDDVSPEELRRILAPFGGAEFSLDRVRPMPPELRDTEERATNEQDMQIAKTVRRASLCVERGKRGSWGIPYYLVADMLGNVSRELPKEMRESLMTVVPGKALAAWLLMAYPEEYSRGLRLLTNRRAYGAATWYEWRVKNWGVKWEASGQSIIDGFLEFDTANSAPLPVIQRLSLLLPGYQLRLCYRIEGEEVFNEGDSLPTFIEHWRVYEGGDLVDSWEDYTVEDYPE